MSKWKIDPAHSSVEFSVKHFGVSWIKGRFGKVKGAAEFEPENPEAASVQAEIQADSIWTADEGRDKHLRSADFFDAEKYPLIIFKSAEVEKSGAEAYKIKGELTMRGAARPVVLDAQFLGAREIPDEKGKAPVARAGVVAKTIINRHDFGVSWDAPCVEGATTAGAEVAVVLNMELVREI